jgi:hypothetical protein
MKTKDTNYIGQVVRLQTNFLNKCKDIDNINVPEKVGRPYLVLPLIFNGHTKLFAVPVYSKLSATVDIHFRTVFTPRIKTPLGRKHAIVYSCMLPITKNIIRHKAFESGKVPKSDINKQLELDNIKIRNLQSIPVKAQADFLKLQGLCSPQRQKDGSYKQIGIEVFDNKEFCESYTKVAKSLFNHFIVEVSNNLASIIDKAQRYLDKHYIPYSNGKRVTMAKYTTNINKLAEFAFVGSDEERNFVMAINNGVKTSLQSPPAELSAEDKALLAKYPIDEKKLQQAKQAMNKLQQEHKDKKLSLEGCIRANIIYAPNIYGKELSDKIWAEEQAKNKAVVTKSQVKTQEKTVTKTAVLEPKNTPKKRPVNYK